MTDAGTTQNNFILPVPPVGGLPLSQNRLDRMKLVRNRTIPITHSHSHTDTPTYAVTKRRVINLRCKTLAYNYADDIGSARVLNISFQLVLQK